MDKFVLYTILTKGSTRCQLMIYFDHWFICTPFSKIDGCLDYGCSIKFSWRLTYPIFTLETELMRVARLNQNIILYLQSLSLYKTISWKTLKRNVALKRKFFTYYITLHHLIHCSYIRCSFKIPEDANTNANINTDTVVSIQLNANDVYWMKLEFQLIRGDRSVLINWSLQRQRYYLTCFASHWELNTNAMLYSFSNLGNIYQKKPYSLI